MVGADENLAGMKCHSLFLIPTVADFILYQRRVNKNQFFFFTYGIKAETLDRNEPPYFWLCAQDVHASPGLIALTHA